MDALKGMMSIYDDNGDGDLDCGELKDAVRLTNDLTEQTYDLPADQDPAGKRARQAEMRTNLEVLIQGKKCEVDDK